MKCSKCGIEIPNDSSFCQYCGAEIPKVKRCAHCNAELSDGMRFCAMCGKQVVSVGDIASNLPVSTVTKKKRKCRPIWLLIVSAITVISIAFNVFQYFMHDNAIAQKDTRIATLEQTISSKLETITSLRKQVVTLQDKGDSYDDIVTGMTYGNAGYASSNFFVSDSVIVVSRRNQNRKFTLTANWPSGGTVEVEYSSSAAWVSFDNDEWYESTQMTVHPQSEGVTIVTFRNSVDSKTFKMLIIVT